MELTVTQRRDNGLLQRTEVYFTITHPEGGTPGRAEIRKALAASLNAKGIVVLDWARSEFGRPSTRGYAKVYESKERALALETPPILIRNGLVAPKKKVEAPAEAAPAAPAPKREEKAKATPKAEPPKKEAPPKEEKKEAPKAPAKEERKEAPKAEKEPAKKEAAKAEAPKEKKAAAKKGGK